VEGDGSSSSNGGTSRPSSNEVPPHRVATSGRGTTEGDAKAGERIGKMVPLKAVMRRIRARLGQMGAGGGKRETLD